jgi:transcriptional regulator
MYVPAAFRESDPATLYAFVERHSFALLCSTGADSTPFASHLPLLLDRHVAPGGVLVGHMARANPHWQYADGRPVLAVFAGPHAYVSPSWYQAEHVVPTWNYVAVHVTGTFRAVHERDALLQIVRDTVAVYEGPRPQPWWLGEPDDYLERMLRAIVGFRIEVSGMEGKWKLSQNRPAEQRERVRRALREQGGDDAEAIADLMERRDPGANSGSG